MDELERLRQQLDMQEKQIYFMDKAIRDYERMLGRYGRYEPYYYRYPKKKVSKPKGSPWDPFVLLERLLLKALDGLEWFVGCFVDYSAEKLSQLWKRRKK